MKFFEIKNKTDKSFDLYFYGDICKDSLYKWTDEDKCPKEIINLLAEADGRDLNIYINSDGGSVTAGLAIYHQIKRYNGKKTVTIDGIGASIASVIAFSGDKLIMPENTYLMIHKPHGAIIGNADECRRYAEILDGMEDTILNIYEENKKENVTRDDIKNMLSCETWLNGKQASEFFNIEVVPENKAVALNVSSILDRFSKNSKIPSELNQAKNDAEKIRAETKDLAKSKLKLLDIKNRSLK